MTVTACCCPHGLGPGQEPCLSESSFVSLWEGRAVGSKNASLSRDPGNRVLGGHHGDSLCCFVTSTPAGMRYPPP